MILAKIANDSIPFSILYHHLKFRILNFDGAYLLRKTFGTLGFLFTITHLDVYYNPLKLIPSFIKHPVYIYIYIYQILMYAHLLVTVYA